jgi:hypothetical protein
MNKKFYTFRFVPEGFNQVYADNKEAAIEAAKKEFPSLAHQIDEKSFRCLETQKEINSYYASFPLMD